MYQFLKTYLVQNNSLDITAPTTRRYFKQCSSNFQKSPKKNYYLIPRQRVKNSKNNESLKRKNIIKNSYKMNSSIITKKEQSINSNKISSIHKSQQKTQPINFMDQYIQEWKILKSKDNQGNNFVAYTPTFRCSIKNKKNINIIPKETQLIVKHSFSYKKYPKLIDSFANNLHLDQQLCNFSSIMVININTLNYFQTKIYKEINYRSFLKINTKQLNISLNSSWDRQYIDIFLCILINSSYQQNFFWIGNPIKHSQKTSILYQIMQFLKEVLSESYLSDFYLKDNQKIWIIDYQGRVSFVKFKYLIDLVGEKENRKTVPILKSSNNNQKLWLQNLSNSIYKYDI